MSSGSIIPDRDILVLGAGGDKFLPNADIQSGDFILVEWSHNIAEPCIVIFIPILFQIDVSSDNLT